jgi:lipopolysaccharide transport system permease protein
MRDNFFTLLWALIVREIKGQYSKSILGPTWAIIQPLFYMVIFTFLRGTLNISSEGIPYTIFTYSALVPWTFLSNSIIRCGPSIYLNAGIIKKMAIRREIFPIVGVITSFMDFLLSSIILAGMMIWFRVNVGWPVIWLPVLIFLIAILGLGAGLLVSAMGTYKKDIIYGLPFIMQFWLLATPVMYPVNQVPEKWLPLYQLNPMVGLVEGFRFALVKGINPDIKMLTFSILGIAFVWLIAWPFFRYMSQFFADIL